MRITHVRTNPWLLLWLLPVALLIGLELIARHTVPFDRMWYENVRSVAQRYPIDYLLLGTSRTAAAIDPRLAARLLSKDPQSTARVATLAGGYLTMQMSVLAVEALLRDFPEHTRGMTVVMEMPGGLPPISGSWAGLTEGWDGAWAEPDAQPERLTRLITPRNLDELWSSGTALEVKLQVTARYLARGSALISGSESLRARILNFNERALRKVLTLAGMKRAAATVDLDTAGGIRADAADAERVRAAFQSWKVADWQGLTTLDWDRSLIGELARELQARGGRLAGYYVPISSFDAETLQDPQAAEALRRFHAWADSRDVAILDTGLKYADSDFPDGLHLARSHRDDFTGALTRQFTHPPRLGPQSVR